MANARQLRSLTKIHFCEKSVSLTMSRQQDHSQTGLLSIDMIDEFTFDSSEKLFPTIEQTAQHIATFNHVSNQLIASFVRERQLRQVAFGLCKSRC